MVGQALTEQLTCFTIPNTEAEGTNARVENRVTFGNAVKNQ